MSKGLEFTMASDNRGTYKVGDGIVDPSIPTPPVFMGWVVGECHTHTRGQQKVWNKAANKAGRELGKVLGRSSYTRETVINKSGQEVSRWVFANGVKFNVTHEHYKVKSVQRIR